MPSNFMGSEEVLTTSSNEEIIPKTPEGWSNDRHTLKKFSFINRDPCTVKINDGKPIYLNENQGFESGREDAPIHSFIIVESGVDYSWIGAI